MHVMKMQHVLEVKRIQSLHITNYATIHNR